jgi:hypothetical protein
MRNKIKTPIGLSALLGEKSLVKVSGKSFKLRELIVKNLKKSDGAFVQFKGEDGDHVSSALTIEDAVSLRIALDLVIKEGL